MKTELLSEKPLSLRAKEGGLQGVKKKVTSSVSWKGRCVQKLRGGLCTQEAEDKVTVTGALKPTVTFKIPSQVNMMPKSILHTDLFYTRMNYPSKNH